MSAAAEKRMASSYMDTAGVPVCSSASLSMVYADQTTQKSHITRRRRRIRHKNQTVFNNSVLRSQKTTALGDLRRNHEGRLTLGKRRINSQQNDTHKTRLHHCHRSTIVHDENNNIDE